MHLSLRSHLTAGTAAVVAVGAIAVTPAPATPLTLPSINVALAAFSSPLAQLFATADLADNYVFDPVSNPANAASWPYANFGTTFGTPASTPPNFPLLPAALADSSLGGYSSVGLISQFIDDALPIINQLGYNGLDYINVTGNAVFFAGETLTQAVWTAAGEALMGDFASALTTISDAISSAGTALLETGTYVFQSVVTHASAVVGTLVGSLPLLLGASVLQAQVVAASVGSVLTNTVAALDGGDIEGAWNAAVDGLLGPSGIPGTLLNLSFLELDGVSEAALASRLVTERFEAGDAIYRQGEPADRIVFVMSGRVEIMTETDGTDRRRVAVISQGNHCGDLRLTPGERRAESAYAMDTCIIRSLSREALSAGMAGLLDRSPVQRRIVTCLLRDGSATGQEVCERLPDLGEVAITTALTELHDEGALRLREGIYSVVMRKSAKKGSADLLDRLSGL